MLYNLPSFADKPLTLTFEQLNINPQDFNGWSFDQIRPAYINMAADYMLDFAGEYDYETFQLALEDIDNIPDFIELLETELDKGNIPKDLLVVFGE